MSTAKQPLIRERRSHTKPAGMLTMALPFYRGFRGTLFHRVRSGLLHRLGEEHHISLKFWCGNGGFIDHRRERGRTGGGELFATTPANATHCAPCEAKAIGAGLDGARTINGRNVLYSPPDMSCYIPTEGQEGSLLVPTTGMLGLQMLRAGNVSAPLSNAERRKSKYGFAGYAVLYEQRLPRLSARGESRRER